MQSDFWGSRHEQYCRDEAVDYKWIEKAENSVSREEYEAKEAENAALRAEMEALF